MADLLTVYDDGENNTFIDCAVCEKRIRGDTNYKIHLSSVHHLKRERALADQGIIPRPAPLPKWTSITQYLTYLNLNEPVIGLGDLVQESDVFSSEGSPLLQYRCRLCVLQMDIYEMTAHVVGRRHRQKYLERYRPDLVTWEKTSDKQAGIVARAKAAIVEKQNGWGSPVPLSRADKGRNRLIENSLRNRAPDRPSNPQRRTSSGQDGKKQDVYNRSYMESDSYRKPSFYNEDNQYDQTSRFDVSQQPSGSGDNRYDSPYSQNGRQKRSYPDRDYRERPYWKDEMNVGSIPSNEAHDKRYNDKGAPDSYRDEWYQETDLSRGSYKSQGDSDYYRGNTPEGRFEESGIDYQESGRMRDPVYMSPHGAGASLNERQSRNLQYADEERDRFQDVDETIRSGSFQVQDYNHRPSYHQTEGEMPMKKKRKSRFSDATPLEIALAHQSHTDTVASKYTPRGRAVTAKNVGTGYINSTVKPSMENVLDVLNDVHIENVQEANFLKEKLCTLLKEFQSNKAHRGQGQVSHTYTDVTDKYHDGNKMEPLRESRRFDDQGFQESPRYDRDLPGAREYLHTRHVEEDPEIMRQNRGLEVHEYQWEPSRESPAGRSEERMVRHTDDRRGYREGAWSSRALRDEERVYPEEQRHYLHGYRSDGDLYDPFEPSSSPPTGSSTLDKLASTLLELVAHKTNLNAPFE